MTTIDIGRKEGGLLCPFCGGGELGSRLTQHGLGRGLLQYQVAFTSIHPFATIDMGRKLGAVPFLGGQLGPHLTTSLGLRPSSIPSGILIHPAIWPQRTWAENWGAGSWVPI